MIPIMVVQEFRADRFDPQRRFVRVRRVRDDGFVEFEFAIGDPTMFVEMILPQQALAGFCAAHHATLLDDGSQPPAAAGQPDEHWTLSDATRQRFRSRLRE